MQKKIRIFSRTRKYVPFLKASILDWMAYKFQIFSWAIIGFINIAFIFFLYFAVYSSSLDGINSIINGFNFKEIVVYTCLTQIFSICALDSQSLYNISQEIKEGTISSSLIKPISYRLRYMFAHIGNLISSSLFIALPVLCLLFSIFIPLGFLVIEDAFIFIISILLFIIGYILASLLNDAISYLFGLMSFYTQAVFGINQLKIVVVGFLSGTTIPLSFFPKIMQDILRFSPFASITSNPVLTLMGKIDLLDSFLMILLGIAWLLFFELINFLVYRQAIKKVSIQGG